MLRVNKTWTKLFQFQKNARGNVPRNRLAGVRTSKIGIQTWAVIDIEVAQIQVSLHSQ